MFQFAHRGDNGHHTENTAAAFDSSLQHGFRGFELDLVRLVDGTLAVFHDDTLMRLFSDSRSPGDLTLEQFRVIFPDLLTYEDLRRLYGAARVSINLEIKDDEETFRKVLPSLSEFRDPVISSFRSEVVDLAIRSGAVAGYLFDSEEEFLRRKEGLLSDRIHISLKMIRHAKDSAALYGDYDVYVYTVNHEEDFSYLKGLPFVRGIFTDRSHPFDEAPES